MKVSLCNKEMVHIDCLYYCTECKYTTETPTVVHCIEYSRILKYCDQCNNYQTIRNLGEDFANKQEALDKNAILNKEIMVHLNNVEGFCKKF